MSTPWYSYKEERIGKGNGQERISEVTSSLVIKISLFGSSYVFHLLRKKIKNKQQTKILAPAFYCYREIQTDTQFFLTS